MYVCAYTTVVLSESLGSTPATHTHTQTACHKRYLGREIVSRVSPYFCVTTADMHIGSASTQLRGAFSLAC